MRSVGSEQERSIDVRILSATHQDLAARVEAGAFRQDLYYRLNVIELPVPSLRERAEDIPLFAAQILERLAQDYQQVAPEITKAAMVALQQYPFPGNVRELENVLERAFTLCEHDRIEPEDLNLGDSSQPPPAEPTTWHEEPAPSDPAPSTTSGAEPSDPVLAPGQSLKEYLESIERKVITDALEKTRWNKTAAAKDLGITFRALRYRLKKLELE